ncbi:helix-turn-helix transcriptional regulator [Candidatus Enterococcus clewellii]|uniref:HTH cro/C1-type domain-containing protein n=1 Tax=Candidatus Enterococcus clewellii TaxID=1834193 RepID=A0A242K8F7_9ENTE|nr:helix-turn-helix transcriptional regulator [Enterococcus sp. 9E7_DIV0242]OTP17451.1 hypothetical protein A5888_001589 [Enterococcus sp. 9E7_DIV0242]
MQSRLSKIRKNYLGMTQKEVAEMLGISPHSYSRKERGLCEFTQDEMLLLYKKTGLSIHYIFLPTKHQNGASEMV